MQVYIKKILILAIFFSILACARTKYEGVIFDETELAKIKIGLTKIEVQNLLGSPSIDVPTIKDEFPSWIYISSEKKWYAFFKPKAIKQKIVEIKFKTDKVFEIKDYKKTI